MKDNSFFSPFLFKLRVVFVNYDSFGELGVGIFLCIYGLWFEDNLSPCHCGGIIADEVPEMDE